MNTTKQLIAILLVLTMVVGLVACLLLVFVAAPLLDNHQLAQGAWFMYFSMLGSSNLYKYLKTKQSSKLLIAILQLFCEFFINTHFYTFFRLSLILILLLFVVNLFHLYFQFQNHNYGNFLMQFL